MKKTIRLIILTLIAVALISCDGAVMNKFFDVPVEKITLNKTTIALIVDNTFNLTATVTPSDATDTTYIWTSDDESVATVDANGLVTAKKIGTATITATSNADTSKTATCTVTVADYLTFKAITAGSTVTLGKSGSPSWSGEYSTDGGSTWTTYTVDTTGAITLTNVGDSVCFKGSYSSAPDLTNYLKFSMTGSIAASGNIMSLCSGDNYATASTIPYDYCFTGLFQQCSVLTTAPELPATTLSNSCYRNMFNGCASLTTAPALPATKLVAYCYFSMFGGCSSLTIAPELPATTLAEFCYSTMFSGCSSLTIAPELPATTLTQACYSQMFLSCAALKTAPALPATELVLSCYTLMFAGCTSLYVSDSQTTDAPYSWTIPSSGTFTNSIKQDQGNIFGFESWYGSCLGTRIGNDSMSGKPGDSHIYYTQNPPV